MKIISFLTRTFFNTLYRLKPPPTVAYWKRSDSARAKVIEQEDGSYGMRIEGEKEIYPGFPRGHALTGPLAKMKHYIKNAVFNHAFAEIEKLAAESKYDMLPPEKMAPAVRHIWETFEKMKDVEIVPDMKARMTLLQKVLTYFLQEDDAYRMRAQLFLDLIDQKKVRLSEADKYFMRGKYVRTDRFTKVFGQVVDKYTY